MFQSRCVLITNWQTLAQWFCGCLTQSNFNLIAAKMNLLCRFSDDLTISPAWPVLHTRVELHQNKNLQKRTISLSLHRCCCFMSMIQTWSVGRRLKSFGGLVITYLLPGASGPALLSRNLNKEYFSPLSTFYFSYLFFRLFAV